MLNRLVRFTLVGVFATALAGYGVSYAQEDDDDDTDAEMLGDEGAVEDEGGGVDDLMDEGTTTEEESTEPTEEGAENENAAPAAEPGMYPAEEIPRPVLVYKGMFEAGVDIPIPNGPDDTGENGIGNWVGVTLRADYGVTEKIQAGIRLPLALVKAEGAETLGGVVLDGRYLLIDKPDMQLAAGTGLSYGYFGLYPITMFAPPMFLDADGMKIGFSPGVNFKKPMGKLAITADPALVLVMDGGVSDSGEAEMLQVLAIPVAVQYQVSPVIAAGVRTGIYSAHKFKFSGDDGARLPLILEGQYTLMEGKMDVGADIGLGSVMTREGEDVGDTLFIGLFANYRNK